MTHTLYTSQPPHPFEGNCPSLTPRWAVIKIRAKRLVRRRVKWETLGSALKEPVKMFRMMSLNEVCRIVEGLFDVSGVLVFTCLDGRLYVISCGFPCFGCFLLPRKPEVLTILVPIKWLLDFMVPRIENNLTFLVFIQKSIHLVISTTSKARACHTPFNGVSTWMARSQWCVVRRRAIWF